MVDRESGRPGKWSTMSGRSMCKSPNGKWSTRKVIDRKVIDPEDPVGVAGCLSNQCKGTKDILVSFHVASSSEAVVVPIRPSSAATPVDKPPLFLKSDISKKSGVLRPPASQSVQGCFARLRTPSVAAPVQKLPLPLKK